MRRYSYIKILKIAELHFNPFWIAENIGIKSKNFSKMPPIIVYQMGKVGSTTISRSLKKANLPNPVYQIHFLSEQGIQFAENAHLKGVFSAVPRHLKRSKALRKKMEREAGSRWLLVTLVREPISRIVSNFFQNMIEFYPDVIEDKEKIDHSKVCAYLMDSVTAFADSKDYISRWFDMEINAVFVIDVYSQPFNQDDGYTIIRGGKADLLILRLEDLDACFVNAIKQFLGVDHPIQLVSSNVSDQKFYSDDMKKVQENLSFPASVLERVYATPYVRHFYGEKDIARFIQRWS